MCWASQHQHCYDSSFILLPFSSLLPPVPGLPWTMALVIGSEHVLLAWLHQGETWYFSPLLYRSHLWTLPSQMKPLRLPAFPDCWITQALNSSVTLCCFYAPDCISLCSQFLGQHSTSWVLSATILHLPHSPCPKVWSLAPACWLLSLLGMKWCLICPERRHHWAKHTGSGSDYWPCSLAHVPLSRSASLVNKTATQSCGGNEIW